MRGSSEPRINRPDEAEVKAKDLVLKWMRIGIALRYAITSMNYNK
jgi:hypothetical protein